MGSYVDYVIGGILALMFFLWVKHIKQRELEKKAFFDVLSVNGYGKIDVAELDENFLAHQFISTKSQPFTDCIKSIFLRTVSDDEAYYLCMVERVGPERFRKPRQSFNFMLFIHRFPESLMPEVVVTSKSTSVMARIGEEHQTSDMGAFHKWARLFKGSDVTDGIGPAFKHQFDLISTGSSDVSLSELFQKKLLEHGGEDKSFFAPFFIYPGMKISSKYLVFAINEIKTGAQLTRLFAFFEELESILRSDRGF